MRILRVYRLVRHFAGLQSLFFTLQQAFDNHSLSFTFTFTFATFTFIYVGLQSLFLTLKQAFDNHSLLPFLPRLLYLGVDNHFSWLINYNSYCVFLIIFLCDSGVQGAWPSLHPGCRCHPHLLQVAK